MFPIFVEFGFDSPTGLLALAFFHDLLVRSWRKAGLPSEKVGDLALVALLGGSWGALTSSPSWGIRRPPLVLSQRRLVYYGDFSWRPVHWFQIRGRPPPLADADVRRPGLGGGAPRLLQPGCVTGPDESMVGNDLSARVARRLRLSGAPPDAIYESFGAFLLAGILYCLFRRNLKSRCPGRVFAAYLVGYGSCALPSRSSVRTFADRLGGPLAGSRSSGAGPQRPLLPARVRRALRALEHARVKRRFVAVRGCRHDPTRPLPRRELRSLRSRINPDRRGVSFAPVRPPINPISSRRVRW